MLAALCIVVAGGPLGASAGRASQPSHWDFFVPPADLSALLDRPGGVAVDGQGNVYVSDTEHHRVQKRSPRGEILAHLGVRGDGPGQLLRPNGIAIGATGTVYVADQGNNRVQLFSALGDVSGAIGTRGAAPGQLASPHGVGLDAAGNLYVADVGNSRVQKLSPTGEPIAHWGSFGREPGQFSTYFNLTVDRDGNVYVADTFNKRIQKFGSTGALLEWWGEGAPSPRDVKLHAPEQIALDASGNLVYSERDAGVVVRIALDGRVLGTYGRPGGVAGTFQCARGVAVDRDNAVYASDGCSGRLHKFAADGTPARAWDAARSRPLVPPGSMAVGPTGEAYFAFAGSHFIQRVGADGRLAAEFDGFADRAASYLYPGGIAVDSRGDVYVVEAASGAIQKLSPDGTPLARWDLLPPGTRNAIPLPMLLPLAVGPDDSLYVADTWQQRIARYSASGQLVAEWPRDRIEGDTHWTPHGIAVDAAGVVYVSDTRNNRIQRYAPDGVPLTPLGTLGEGPGELIAPGALAVDRAGNVYVIDSGNGRLVAFTSDGSPLAEWGGNSLRTLDPAALQSLQDRWSSGIIQPADVVSPKLVATEPTGTSLYVADSATSAVHRLHVTSP